MSFIFNDHVQPITTTFSVHPAHSDSLRVSQSLWDRLSLPQRGRVSLSVFRDLPRARLPRPSKFVCWAILDGEVQDVAVPSNVVECYPQIFCGHPGSLISFVPVQLPVLTEVFVTALSDAAYHAACSRRDFIEEWLTRDSRILCQDSVYNLEPDASPLGDLSPHKLAYRVDMAGPTCQGYAQKQTTKFIITPSEIVSTDGALQSDLTSDDESDFSTVEIDEEFLAHSCLQVPPDGSTELTASARVHDGASPSLGSSTSKVIQLEALVEPLDHNGDDCEVYLHLGDLVNVGVLSGDWAVAYSAESPERRLVRVVAASEPFRVVTGSGLASPVLIFNLSKSLAPKAPVSLLASPFGSTPPTIPTARSVSIARIASALSTDRVYQPLFLTALRNHFHGKKRLVKKGDVIAVGIDVDSAWRMPVSDGKSDEPADEYEETDYEYPLSTRVKNEIIYFMVTDVEHDVLANGHRPSSPDLMHASTAGELGFWVDSGSTRIVQTGLEHAIVPDIGTYIMPSHRSPRALLRSLANSPNPALLSPNSPFGQLYDLVSATSVAHSVDYDLNLSVLLKGSRGVGKVTVANWVAQRFGMHLLEINCFDILGENDVKTEGTLQARFEKAVQCTPCLLVLRHVEALAQTTQVLESGKEPAVVKVLKDCFEQARDSWKNTGFPLVIVGTTSEPSRIPASVLASFKHEITFEAPTESERLEMLRALLAHAAVAPDVSLASLATQTAALVAADLVSLVERARLVALERAHGISDTYLELPVIASDFDRALSKARAAYSETIGAPKIPNVTWDDVGGLAHVKSDILDTIQLPLEHPELFQDGLKKRSGILLYGPPGTGKTLLAKAVATSCSLNFFSVKGPELLNMYIGESEANVRRVFQRARDARPCVIFFDELDSVAPKRGNHGDSGGVMDRIVSQLLAELDGMSSGKGAADVFVIGATNRPDLLDPALLRPGRFDRMLYLGVSETHQAQLNILEALTRKFRVDPNLDLRSVAEKCPFNYTGADFYALCSDAMLGAMSRKAEELEATIAHLNSLPGPYTHPHPLTPQYYLAEMATPEEILVLVSQTDFDKALQNLVPSVSQSEMEHYARVQKQFSTVKAEE